ncbi:MAG: hypothetical protein FJ137_10750 [Deltaproteobacteria bacterium]|nr:hypothetical protein [Deltaproteobacteria bacterium]
MIPGFNHNIKHKGRVFHVQTEDSGPKNPHIITHLFVGGNIVSSKKTQYADLVGQPGYEATVRKMMEEQHKQMLRNLVHGAFDTVEVATAYHLDGPAPLNYTATSPTTNAIAGTAAFTGLPSQLKTGADAPAPAVAPVPDAVTAAAVAAAPVADRPVAVVAAADLAGRLPGAPVSVAVAAAVAPPHARGSDAPITIFGEDLISEKSLDEVILSYLAEDLADVD